MEFIAFAAYFCLIFNILQKVEVSKYPAYSVCLLTFHLT